MVAGFMADYVRRVLNGRCSNEIIRSAAKKLIEDREKLKESVPGKNAKPAGK